MSKSLFTTIIEEVTPSTETVGVVGQLYLDTVEKKLYQCVSITTETVDEVETISYEWEEITNQKLYIHHIKFNESTYAEIYFDIISTDAEPYNNRELVQNKLATYLPANKEIQASGYVQAFDGAPNSTQSVYSIIRRDTTNAIYAYYLKTSYETESIDGTTFIKNVTQVFSNRYYLNVGTFTDVVQEL